MTIHETLLDYCDDEDGFGLLGVADSMLCPKHPETHQRFAADITIRTRVTCHQPPLPKNHTALDYVLSNGVRLDTETATMPTPINVWLCEECGAVAHNGRSDNPHIWEYLGRPSGYDWHRYFRDTKSGRIALVDNSGNSPDDQDGSYGPLWVDRTRPIHMGVDTYSVYGGGPMARLPILEMEAPTGEGARFRRPHVSVPHGDIAWLLRRGFIDRAQIRLPDDMADIVSALGGMA